MIRRLIDRGIDRPLPHTASCQSRSVEVGGRWLVVHPVSRQQHVRANRSFVRSFRFSVPDTRVVIDHEPDLAALHADRITRVIQQRMWTVATTIPRCPGTQDFGLGLLSAPLEQGHTSRRAAASGDRTMVCWLVLWVSGCRRNFHDEGASRFAVVQDGNRRGQRSTPALRLGDMVSSVLL